MSSPRSASELLAWAVERVMIPVGEWRDLLAAINRDHGLAPDAVLAELSGKLVAVAWPSAAGPSVVCAVESVPRVLRALELGQDQVTLSSAALDGAPAHGAVAALASLLARRASPVEDAAEEGDPLGDLLGEVLRFYGPVGRELLTRTFVLDSERERVALEVLLDEQRVVVDELTEDAAEPEICDAENLRNLKDLGVDHLVIIQHDWQHFGYDVKLPDHLPANPRNSGPGGILAQEKKLQPVERKDAQPVIAPDALIGENRPFRLVGRLLRHKEQQRLLR